MPSYIRRQVKNIVNNYSEAEKKVREATSNDPWGPPSSLMSDIADLTYNMAAFSEIMSMLWRRLGDQGKNWRHVHKALTLLDYVVKTGSERVALQCRENILTIQTLANFCYVDRDGRDLGANVREKSKQLVALLNDVERLRSERTQALRTKERTARIATAIGSDNQVRFGHGSSQPDVYSGNVENIKSGGSPASHHRAASACVPSDLEQARPQTSGEEELQLQLALAMSREEAVQEERMRRGDDLRLQMALKESCRGFGAEQEDKRGQQPTLLGVMDTVSESPADQMSDPWAVGTAASDPWQTNNWTQIPESVLPEASRPAPLIDPWAQCPGSTPPSQSGDPWAPPAVSALSAHTAADPWAEGHVAGGASYSMPSSATPAGSADFINIPKIAGLNGTTGMSIRALETHLSPSAGVQNLEPPISTPGHPVPVANPFLLAGVVLPPTAHVNPFLVTETQPPGLNQVSLKAIFSNPRFSSTQYTEHHTGSLSLITTPPLGSVPSVPAAGAAGLAPTAFGSSGTGTGLLTGTSAPQTVMTTGMPPLMGCTTNPFLS